MINKRTLLALFCCCLLGYSFAQTSNQSNIKVANAAHVPGTENSFFEMGSSMHDSFSDVKVHLVRLSTFYISKTEVTNEEFIEFLTLNNVDRLGNVKGNQLINLARSADVFWSKNQFFIKPEKEIHPVTYVTWYGANAYCEWKGGFLPSEAQWEFAANGGVKELRFAGSNNLEDIAWYNENTRSTQPVATKTSNEYGIYDMSGNVMEWVNDWYKSYPTGDPEVDPKGPKKSKYKVTRGGAWNRGADFSTTIKRYPLNPGYSDSNLGFRCAFK